ncbi:pyruvate, water dikinase regulatory protein [Macrococcus armenti]|uniref:Putative pyruvate, phosphate dikinase regulatory protein n=1 Tax=Macrococcus armenti TaxID=2875764 RepID=A0ABY3ZVA2_9STAP|nr:pyruvate, water dikinase regulatory protein [Macrococcus armenti]UOB20824.1 kinase/pyrophosphorylase [Macrococcus armenti]
MSKYEQDALLIYIVSDSIGETADRMLSATLSQFPKLTSVTVKKFSFIKSVEEFKNILTLAHEKQAIVVTTLVNPEFNAIGKAYADEVGLSYIDFMTGLIQVIESHTGMEACHESGALRKMDSDYFKRIEAIEYSVKYDDGKNFHNLSEADALIVGVSRTSKTPLSMYLANKGYKIANIPLVPESPIPESVYQEKNLRVIGLTASPEYIMNIRTERVKILGLTGQAEYNNLKRIKEELVYAEEVFNRLNATVINTEYKSIEESAFYIEKVLNKK